MLEIIFRDSEEAQKFYKYILLQLHSLKLKENDILFSKDDHIARVGLNNENSRLLAAAQKAFYHFIIKIKLNDWFRMILKEQYYYEDEEEQQQILDILQSILEGKRVDLLALMEEFNINQQLEEAISQMYHEHSSFSFDSFVKFRMRPFMERLEKYVEISIDEYKMEQEYQMFIQTLREFLTQRKAKMNHLHLLMNEGITFYNEEFDEMKRTKLITMIDRKLLSNHPVYVDSVTIAPLLSIAPSTIYLYTDDWEQPLIRTIRNIFEERVRIRPVKSFFNRKSLFLCISDEKI